MKKIIALLIACTALAACDINPGQMAQNAIEEEVLQRSVQGDKELERQFLEAKKDGTISVEERAALKQAIVDDKVDDAVEAGTNKVTYLP